MTLRVKEILAQKNIMAKDLAKGIGANESTLSVMLSDKGNPSIGALQKMADFLGVPITDLFVDPNRATFKCPHCGGPIDIYCVSKSE